MSFTLGKDSEKKKRVVVLGAGIYELSPSSSPSSDLWFCRTILSGVIGLTTALRIQEKGLYQVEIIADVLPTDPKTYKYTSQWAV
jgi:hypothetical protein